MSKAFGALAVEQPAFNGWTLPQYDRLLEFTCRRIWRCPTERTLELYARHLSGNHLEVGVGTGYFLRKSRFPTPRPKLALVDINPHCLHYTAARLARYTPVVYSANVLKQLSLALRPVDSIALNYVLHCMPGTLSGKGVVFENLRPYLNDGGVLFGSTVLRREVPCDWRARTAMRVYNASGVFCNLTDGLNDLRTALDRSFKEVRIEIVGCVAQFSARA
jgi:hypothetical protein